MTASSQLLQSPVTLSVDFLLLGLIYSFPFRFSHFGQNTHAITVTTLEDKFFLTEARPKERTIVTSSI